MSSVLDHPDAKSDRETQRIPPLENGDHLTRAEFERRYAAMPHVKKAELIEGVVYMGSPVSLRHSRPHAIVMGWLTTYSADTPGTEVVDNTTIRLDNDNEPQPDASLLIQPQFGGQVTFDEDDYVDGAPELIVETAASTASYDLREKLVAYRRNRVLEYVVWRVDDRLIDWFVWNEGRYDRLEPSEDGTYRSRVFPGLTLNVPAAIDCDLKAVIDTQRAALQTSSHAEFVKLLTSQRKAEEVP